MENCQKYGRGGSETDIAAAVPACLLLPLPPPRGSRYSGCVCEGCGSREPEWGRRKWESIYYTRHLPTALGVVQKGTPASSCNVYLPNTLLVCFLASSASCVTPSSIRGLTGLFKISVPARTLRPSRLLPNTTHLSARCVSCLSRLELF